jgi:hypothetical protein
MEQLEEHFETLDEAKTQPGGEFDFSPEDVKANPAGVIEKLCPFYQSVRPFFDWTTRFFLIPKKVKTWVVAFMGAMDKLCPESV